MVWFKMQTLKHLWKCEHSHKARMAKIGSLRADLRCPSEITQRVHHERPETEQKTRAFKHDPGIWSRDRSSDSHMLICYQAASPSMSSTVCAVCSRADSSKAVLTEWWLIIILSSQPSLHAWVSVHVIIYVCTRAYHHQNQLTHKTKWSCYVSSQGEPRGSHLFAVSTKDQPRNTELCSQHLASF